MSHYLQASVIHEKRHIQIDKIINSLYFIYLGLFIQFLDILSKIECKVFIKKCHMCVKFPVCK